MKKFYLILFLVLIAFRLSSQIPEGYYVNAEGKTGEELQYALHLIIDNHTSLSYSDLWDAFYYTDRKSNGKVWDMYSDVPGGTPAYEYDFYDDQCGNYSGEGSCYNREHSFPKSWFDDGYPMYTDLFHLYPTDGYVNGQRSNFPFGEVNNPDFTSTNGSKKGPCSYPGYSGDAFEPIDEYKGDFARSYFYMATRYYDVIDSWNSAMLDGSQHPAFTQWAINMLMEWHTDDPVSQKEINRNNVIYNDYQHNRNPYIDHPEYVNLVWGSGTPEYTITASAGANGSINPSGNITVTQGQSKTFTITPNTGYRIESLIVDGVNVGTNSSYTFTNITANHTIHASFAINTFTISATAGLNGSISPSGNVSVNYGQSKSFTVSPSTGYHIESVIVDGVNIGTNTTYTFSNVTANHTIHATFAINTYTISASAGLNGSISPSGNIVVEHGQDKTFSISPNTGYHIDDVLVNGNSIGIESTFTFNNVTSNHTISVSFEIDSYLISAAAGPNGSISPSGSVSVDHGGNLTFTISPDVNYHIEDVLVNSVSIGAVEIYQFVNVTSNQTITASFALNTYTITSSSSDYGNIEPEGEVVLNHGTSQTFAINPDESCYITAVLVDGQNVGLTSSYTFSNVIQNHTIHAEFSTQSPGSYTITASAGENGTISPSGSVEVMENDNKLFTIIPNDNYHVSDVLIDGESAGPITSYTFIGVDSDHTIHAEFGINTYVITAVANENGNISPSGQNVVEHGQNITFMISPNEGYQIEKVLIDSNEEGALSTYTFENVTENHSIEAFFVLKSYTINATTDGNGSISPEGDVSVAHGDDQTFTIKPFEGFDIQNVLVDDVSVGIVDSYTFENITSNHSIKANFKVKTFTIIASTGENGTISPSGTIGIEYGDDILFTINPDSNYAIEDVLVDGVSAGNASEYLFENVTEDHTIEAFFSSQTFTIIASAYGNGSIEPEGEIVVDAGDSKSFDLVPNDGYFISDVRIDGVSIEPVSSYTFVNIKSDHTIDAHFEPMEHTLSISVIGSGKVQVNGEDYTEPINFQHGTSLSLNAIPDEYWQFESWSGDISGRDTPISIIIDGNTNVITNFIEIPNIKFTLTISITGNGEVTVDNESYTAPVTVDKGTTLTINALPAQGWVFSNWSGDITGRDTPQNITMNSNKTVNSIFSELTDVESHTTNDVLFFPNPFSTYITLSNATQVKSVQFSNILGQKIFEKITNGSQQITIDTQHLPRGIYLVSLRLNNNKFIFNKMIKE